MDIQLSSTSCKPSQTAMFLHREMVLDNIKIEQLVYANWRGASLNSCMIMRQFTQKQMPWKWVRDELVLLLWVFCIWKFIFHPVLLPSLLQLIVILWGKKYWLWIVLSHSISNAIVYKEWTSIRNWHNSTDRHSKWAAAVSTTNWRHRIL